MIGFVFFLIYIKNPHTFFRGCINTKWNSYSGLSLGLFVFTPDENCKELQKYSNNSQEELARRSSMILVHEYGHAYQSFALGPFYLIPGICSLCWGRMKRYKKLREKYGVPYSFYWVENWANSWGEKVTKLPSIGQID
ncbi:hypothetical protein [Herbinix luporum]|jgi:hypothetical protein|nr:hypothetical protein [Herbinix luporum]HHT56332.1 hypothetical protein [Herbinix luporum]